MRSALRQLLLGGVGSLAAQALLAEGSGLAFDARDMSASVKGHTTNFDGDANGLFTYSSPSTKYVRNAAGVFVPGTTMRCDHDASGNKLGLLIEEQRTNLFLRSAEFDNASWAKTNATVTANAIAGPDGQTVADKIISTSATGLHFVSQAAINPSTAYVATCFAKAGEETALVMANDNTGIATFRLNDGSLGTVSAGSAGIFKLPDGWYLCVWVFTSGGSASTAFRLTLRQNASFTGDGSSGLYLWGADLQPGVFRSSYIQTAGSQVTRAADTITLATTAFPFSATAGIHVVEAWAALGAGTHVLIQIDDGTANERIRIVRNTSNEIHCVVTDGGVDQCDLNLGAVANDTAFKVAFSWAANDFAASLNGGAVQTDTGGTLPTVTTLRLGSGNSAYWNGRLRRAKHLPRNRASDAELQVMAT